MTTEQGDALITAVNLTNTRLDAVGIGLGYIAVILFAILLSTLCLTFWSVSRRS